MSISRNPFYDPFLDDGIFAVVSNGCLECGEEGILCTCGRDDEKPIHDDEDESFAEQCGNPRGCS